MELGTLGVLVIEPGPVVYKALYQLYYHSGPFYVTIKHISLSLFCILIAEVYRFIMETSENCKFYSDL